MILDELKSILSNLYATHGLKSHYLRLSQLVDILINQEMNGRGLYER